MFLFFCLFFWGSAQASFLEIKLSERIELNLNDEIELCWLTAKNSNTRELQIKIERFVGEQFLRADLKTAFVGLCLESPRAMEAIGIAFYDDPANTEGLKNTMNSVIMDEEYPGHPSTYSQGSYVQYNLVEIILTSHLEKVRPSLVAQAAPLSEKGLDSLLLSIALHEILHAVGFSHEHNRPDSVCTLEKDQTYHPKSNTLIGEYDAVSLMNPCYTKQYDFENEGPIILSAGDLQSLRYLYSSLRPKLMRALTI